MIWGVEGLAMSAGPKGIDRPSPIGPEVRMQTPPPQQARKPGNVASIAEPDAVLHLSSRAIGLCRRLMAEELTEDERLDRIAQQLVTDGCVVDSRRTAEAIMRRAVPELYQALVAAGEAEE